MSQDAFGAFKNVVEDYRNGALDFKSKLNLIVSEFRKNVNRPNQEPIFNRDSKNESKSPSSHTSEKRNRRRKLVEELKKVSDEPNKKQDSIDSKGFKVPLSPDRLPKRRAAKLAIEKTKECYTLVNTGFKLRQQNGVVVYEKNKQTPTPRRQAIEIDDQASVQRDRHLEVCVEKLPVECYENHCNDENDKLVSEITSDEVTASKATIDDVSSSARTRNARRKETESKDVVVDTNRKTRKKKAADNSTKLRVDQSNALVESQLSSTENQKKLNETNLVSDLEKNNSGSNASNQIQRKHSSTTLEEGEINQEESPKFVQPVTKNLRNKRTRTKVIKKTDTKDHEKISDVECDLHLEVSVQRLSNESYIKYNNELGNKLISVRTNDEVIVPTVEIEDVSSTKTRNTRRKKAAESKKQINETKLVSDLEEKSSGSNSKETFTFSRETDENSSNQVLRKHSSTTPEEGEINQEESPKFVQPVTKNLRNKRTRTKVIKKTDKKDHEQISDVECGRHLAVSVQRLSNESYKKHGNELDDTLTSERTNDEVIVPTVEIEDVSSTKTRNARKKEAAESKKQINETKLVSDLEEKSSGSNTVETTLPFQSTETNNRKRVPRKHISATPEEGQIIVEESPKFVQPVPTNLKNKRTRTKVIRKAEELSVVENTEIKNKKSLVEVDIENMDPNPLHVGTPQNNVDSFKLTHCSVDVERIESNVCLDVRHTYRQTILDNTEDCSDQITSGAQCVVSTVNCSQPLKQEESSLTPVSNNDRSDKEDSCDSKRFPSGPETSCSIYVHPPESSRANLFENKNNEKGDTKASVRDESTQPAKTRTKVLRKAQTNEEVESNPEIKELTEHLNNPSVGTRTRSKAVKCVNKVVSCESLVNDYSSPKKIGNETRKFGLLLNTIKADMKRDRTKAFTSSTPIVKTVPSAGPSSVGKSCSGYLPATKKRKLEEATDENKTEEVIKKNYLLEKKREILRKHREEKLKKAAEARAANEKQRLEKLLKMEREKQEREKMIKAEMEKHKEDMLNKKKLINQQKALEAEERRVNEERSRMIRQKQQEEERKRLEAEAQKAKEYAERLRQQRIIEEESRLRKEKEAQKKKDEMLGMINHPQSQSVVASTSPLSDPEDYGIDSEYIESDDEEYPKKPVPQWATKEGRTLRLRQQANIPLEVIISYYGRNQSPDLQEMFGALADRRVRTSSAIWVDTPPR